MEWSKTRPSVPGFYWWRSRSTVWPHSEYTQRVEPCFVGESDYIEFLGNGECGEDYTQEEGEERGWEFGDKIEVPT